MHMKIMLENELLKLMISVPWWEEGNIQNG